MTSRQKVIESLIYIRGDKGIKCEEIKEVFSLETIATAKEMMVNFVEKFNNDKRGLRVEEFNEIYKFATIPEAKDFISELVTGEQRQKLSDSAIETVGIVAYKAPITRSSINDIRGKNSDHIVSVLLLKGLIEEVGISKSPGTPILYGVTDKFYDYFRIRSLNQLPRLSEFNNIDLDSDEEEIDLFSSQRDE
ncbi:MAG: SMC-Scp complex subunit ScpB [Mycoplasmataceae bacterium]|nr:SMC-Scp complex subunit ScpB [Mycoplasmataceae bacterium]